MSQFYNRGLIEDFGRWREFSTGMRAWTFHKFTGRVLADYFLTHIAVLSTALSGATTYTNMIQALESLLVAHIFEIRLFAVAVLHILNGLRLLFVDLGAGLEAQDKSFYAPLILTGVIVVVSAPTSLSGVSI